MPDLDFTTILSREFRWPREGDQAFTRSHEWQENAYVHSVTQGRHYMMTSGYKKGADLMVESALKSTADASILVFPIIFSYRQFLELWLKHLIDTYGHHAGVEPEWKSHSLSHLWRQFQKVVKGWDAVDPGGADAVVHRIVLEFDQVDPHSFAFRYPVDTKGEPIALAHEELDLARLAEVMEGVDAYFIGCDGFLDNLRGAFP